MSVTPRYLTESESGTGVERIWRATTGFTRCLEITRRVLLEGLRASPEVAIQEEIVLTSD